MPLYEFCCDGCGDFEAWRAIDDRDRLMYCPGCQNVAKRIFSPSNISLNVGSFQSRQESKKPKLVQREIEPEKLKNQSVPNRRPWMINH
jgi:putative FmdB family regulatory protein